MSITRRWLWIAFAGNIVLIPILFALFNPALFDDPLQIAVLSAIMLIFSVIAGIISLLVVVIIPVAFASSVKDTKHELPIYFFGQLLVPLVLGGWFGYIDYSNMMRDEKDGNIEDNREFVEEGLRYPPDHMDYTRYDTLRLIAFYHLESTFSNKNDLLIRGWYIVRKDTVIEHIPDTALYVDFIYSIATKKDDLLTSRHLIHPSVDSMLYAGIPLQQNPTLFTRVVPKLQNLEKSNNKNTRRNWELVQDSISTLKLRATFTTHPLK